LNFDDFVCLEVETEHVFKITLFRGNKNIIKRLTEWCDIFSTLERANANVGGKQTNKGRKDINFVAQ